MYSHAATQFVIAVIIALNFICEAAMRQIDPYEPEYQYHRNLWFALDQGFTIFFLIELLVNFYGAFFVPFFRSGWNWLDLVLGVLGVVSLVSHRANYQFVRLLRTFRVVRIFKGLQSLNSIITALVRSIPSVAAAFFIMLVVMTLYALIGVDAFRDFGHSGEYVTWQTYGIADAQYGEPCGVDALECTSGSKLGGAFRNATRVSAVTARGLYYGQEYFGNFGRALYTLLQVLTGESWSECVVRPLFLGVSRRSHRAL